MSGSDEAPARTFTGSWKTAVKAVALLLLCAAPVGAGVGLLAADRFSDALGARDHTEGSQTVDARAWSSLGELGQEVDFGLFVSRISVEEAVAATFAKLGGLQERDLGNGTRLRIESVETVPGGPDLKLTLRARVETGFFGADLSARATLEPSIAGAGVGFSPAAVETSVEGAGLKRPTFNPGDAAAKAEPAIEAASDRLREAMSSFADLSLPLTLPFPAGPSGKPAKVSAAFMFDKTGMHVIGKLDAPKPDADDDLLTGSLGSAGLTLDHYRAAFRAAKDKFIASADPADAAAELVLSRDVLSKLLGDAGTRTCTPLTLDTEPLTVTGQVRLSEPPAAPQCGRIAAACAARDLCAKADECQDRVVEETVEETVKVPVRRSGCARREFVCYGWGPYGCAWGQNVCVAPRRGVEYRDKVVQRVVARTEPAAAPKCQSLRDMQSGDPGLCRRLAAGKAPECELVSGAASTADCEARGATLDRLRGKPTATATLRIIGRGRLQACTKGALSADLGSAELATTISGKADILAEVTIRPDGRSDGDAALRCTVEPAAAVKGSAKVQVNRTRTVTLKASSVDGAPALTGQGEAASISIALDKSVTGSLFGAKSGLTYRCRMEGAAGSTFAQWESRIGPALEEIAAKAGKLVSIVPAPVYEARLPRALLLGRDAEAQVSATGAVFSVR